ncbi:MAG: carbohydrate-binding domain-containing protein [Erysipelotrichaceae bacterium]|nr:carbohydrate-binding domain-containing protein [Erysipelotrichaceae bacterium]
MKTRKITLTFLSLLTAVSLMGCSAQNNNLPAGNQPVFPSGQPSFPSGQNGNDPFSTPQTSTETVSLNTEEQFSERDLSQQADLGDAAYLSVADGQDITITAEGVYVLSGRAENVTVTVKAEEGAKVQLVLDGLTITNSGKPCIYVKSADKVFITTAGSDSSLTVTGQFSYSEDEKADAVIYSKDDLVLNGTGKLVIVSSDNAVKTKDDLKITGGSYEITCANNALRANDSIRIADGSISITTEDDGLHAEDDDDDTTGYIYIASGSLSISAGDDAVHATTLLQIDGGSLTITAAEGLEATEVVINDGTVTISASDDGINASRKSESYYCFARFTGGNVTITMGQGDTDGVDVNGDLFIEGGTISVTGQSCFDYDGCCSFTGGTVYTNGQQVSEITNQFMGGQGGFPGSQQPGGQGGQKPGGKNGH